MGSALKHYLHSGLLHSGGGVEDGGGHKQETPEASGSRTHASDVQAVTL